MPTVNTPEYAAWVKEARKFGKAIWDITGKRDPDIVFEHPGEATFPVSCLVVKRGGMVVFCAGTTGYNITFDARFTTKQETGKVCSPGCSNTKSTSLPLPVMAQIALPNSRHFFMYSP